MTIKADEQVNEWAYLEHVLGVIATKMKVSDGQISDAKKNVVEARKHMWENLAHHRPNPHDLELIVNIAQVRTEMNWQERQLDIEHKRMLRLRAQEDSPYFGRIDFVESKEDRATIYIGTFALVDERHNPLIYDWRAPVCSMFYECEVGPAHYVSPAGIVYGELMGKRQYRIKRGQMLFMFDSSLKIDDDVLQEVLAQTTDERMKTIVSSIQREQNRAIRDEGHQLLVVHGGAGSGKTSIALHRAAYLLYTHRETMTADSIVIFSPNHIFGDYISGVLPELGEENILQTTWADYVTSVFKAKLSIESYESQLESLLTQDTHRSHRRLASCKLKATSAFAQAISAYVQRLTNEYRFTPISAHGDLILSAEEQRRLFLEEYSFIPPARRLEKLSRRAELLIDEWARLKRSSREKEIAFQESWLPVMEVKERAKEQVRAVAIPLKSSLSGRFAMDALRCYRDLFIRPEELWELLGGTEPVPGVDKSVIKDICTYTYNSVSSNSLEYEDSAPLLYLKILIDGVASRSEIKHVIVDEAQDYNAIQYRIMRQVFGWGNFTVLGDMNQRLSPAGGIENFSAISKEMDITNGIQITLTRTYRNTYEIAQFAGSLIDFVDVPEPVNRRGAEPVVENTNADLLADVVHRHIMSMRKASCNSIGVICKTAAEADLAWRSIGEPAELMTAGDLRYKPGVVVMPSYLAKGLEFDGVIVWNASKSVYGEEDGRLLYTICTRALHYLAVLYVGEPSPLLSKVP